MKLYQVVLKDILRRKKRVLYATLGVIIATMTVVGVLTIAWPDKPESMPNWKNMEPTSQ